MARQEAAAQPGLTTSSMLGQAAGSNSSAAGIYLNQFGAQSQAANQKNAIFGDLLGAGIKAAAYASSEKLKDMKGEVDGAAAAKAIEDAPARHWSYKAGLGDANTKARMGPTAESLQKVAPAVSNGKEVDMIAQLGLQHAAIGSVSKRLGAIEKKLGLADAKPTQRKVA